VKHLPPAPTPEPRAPAIAPAEPPEEGRGRIIVDVVDGPSRLHIVRMDPEEIQGSDGKPRFRFAEAYELICETTPCVIDPLAGNVLLGFPVIGDPSAMEIELVHVTAETSVYRRALSRRHHRPANSRFVLGVLATSLGAASAVTGTALLPIGLAKDNDGLTLAGSVTLGVGAVAVVLGIWAIRLEADTRRPGSAVHFPF
jgi:hypothetical protein